MFPTLGQIVIYRLTQSDADLIAKRRTSSESIKNRLRHNPPTWPEGAQAHVGDPVTAGDLLPLLVTYSNPDEGFVNGQVFLNGNDTLWVTAITVVTDEASAPGQAITLDDQLGFAASEGAGRKSKARR